MRIIVLLICFCCMGKPALAQSYPGGIPFSKIPVPSAHYQQEFTYDSTLHPADWISGQNGLQVTFATTDELYFRSEVPQLERSMTWEATGWKGERLNAQILVWSADTLEQVHFLPGILKNTKGLSLPKSGINLQLVRFVAGNYPYGAKDVTCGASPYKDLYLMPDRFEEFERFDLPGKTMRPVWLSFSIPASAEVGVYTGSLEVRTSKEKKILTIRIRVQQPILPPPSEWKHRLDLWQNPWVVAWKNGVTPWSEEHKLLLKKHLKLYADAGGKYITTYGVHSPWADNSYMIEGTMIEWIKTAKGGWKFDYTIFDEYIQLCMSLGINKAITIYTPVPWGFRFRYMDQNTGNYVYESWSPDSDTYKKNWDIFLTDLKRHLEQKGWFNKTYLGINENEMSQTLAAIKLIKEHSKSWKITYAGDYHPELDGLLDDYSFLYGKESDPDVVKKRSLRGLTTSYYVCCNPPVPNNFVFSPPVEGRWLGWYTTAHNYDGFLRWAYDAWPADPVRDARHELWPAGDCFLVYPGGNSCIRLEKLREGIIDFEKIRILRQAASKSSDPSVKSLMQELEDHLKVFLSEKDFDSQKIRKDVDKGKSLVKELSDRLYSRQPA